MNLAAWQLGVSPRHALLFEASDNSTVQLYSTRTHYVCTVMLHCAASISATYSLHCAPVRTHSLLDNCTDNLAHI
jgi:hypothetical protein